MSKLGLANCRAFQQEVIRQTTHRYLVEFELIARSSLIHLQLSRKVRNLATGDNAYLHAYKPDSYKNVNWQLLLRHSFLFVTRIFPHTEQVMNGRPVPPLPFGPLFEHWGQYISLKSCAILAFLSHREHLSHAPSVGIHEGPRCRKRKRGFLTRR